ncbi:hypothetical protein KEJ27_06515 [Candidatus Bathyarchaeota archaeon]|nr:hypothetical protein [Candidatus Bathyarchaeota archaeon]MBS7612762.1 hypothetical protein [Candidatus Bathyarchaeota archaeon]MBS7618322.1 hypothetical protein [Candidatus Bathyarchaeota archaeon]
MHVKILIPGLAILIIGASLLAYGFIWKNNLAGLIEAEGWNTTWYRVIDSYGTWGEVIGSSTLPATFGRTTIIYEDWSEEFGFRAIMDIYLEKDETVVFQTGSDDGIMLYVDGELVVNSWVLRGYTLDPPVKVNLSAGTHTLELWYYEWHGANEASFDMHVDDQWDMASTMQTAGGGILFIGAIVSIIGLILKPKVR